MSPRGGIDVEALKEEFDRGFAAPLGAEEAIDDLLAVRVGGDRYAFRILDVVGLVADRRAVPVPSASAGFLGVMGLRGIVVAVWSLGALLGYGAEPTAPRWTVLVGSKTAAPDFALAVEHFDGHLRVPRALFVEAAAPEPGRARAFLRQAARIDGSWHGVLAPDLIARELGRRLGLETKKELL